MYHTAKGWIGDKRRVVKLLGLSAKGKRDGGLPSLLFWYELMKVISRAACHRRTAGLRGELQGELPGVRPDGLRGEQQALDGWLRKAGYSSGPGGSRFARHGCSSARAD